MQAEQFYKLQVVTGYINRLAQVIGSYKQGKQADDMRLANLKAQLKQMKAEVNPKPDIKSQEAAIKKVQEDNINNEIERNQEILSAEARMIAFKKVELEILKDNFPKDCLPKE